MEHEAHVAMVRAKQKVADVKKLRGYFAKPEPTSQQKAEREARIREMQKVMPCRARGPFGHWSKIRNAASGALRSIP
eukprot:5203057-Alexandrium_andersonii.AAC.1